MKVWVDVVKLAVKTALMTTKLAISNDHGR
jgi:hypothetical protein